MRVIYWSIYICSNINSNLQLLSLGFMHVHVCLLCFHYMYVYSSRNSPLHILQMCFLSVSLYMYIQALPNTLLISTLMGMITPTSKYMKLFHVRTKLDLTP